MPLRTLALALLLVTTPALAFESPFSDPRRTGRAYVSSDAAFASNGIDYLAVWAASSRHWDAGTHVYGAQVHGDGSVVGEIAMQLDAGTGAKAAYGVSLSAGRDGYFAAWLTDKGMTAAVLDSYGRVERTVSVPQTFSDPYGHTLTAWDGSTHIVLSDFSGQGTTGIGAYYATLVDDNANIIASNIPVGTCNPNERQAVIADSSGFLVVASRAATLGVPSALLGRRIAPNGSIGEWFEITTMKQWPTSLAAVNDGPRDLIAWTDGLVIWTAELEPQTNTLVTPRQIVWNGAESLRMVKVNGVIWLTWAEYSTRSGMRAYATALNDDRSQGLEFDLGFGSAPMLAGNGQSVLSARPTGNLVGRFLSPLGTDFVISKSQTDQEDGDLASDGKTVLATWAEDLGATREIFAARHLPTGATPDAAGVKISAGKFNSNPTAAWNGKDWLIAWWQSDNTGAFVVARRFSAEGNVIDSQDIVLGRPVGSLSHSDCRPRIASDGSGWVVAWSTTRAPGGCGRGQSIRPMVSRISANGVLLDPDGVDVTASIALDTADFDIAWDGSRYVAAWVNSCWDWHPSHTPATYSVTGATLSADLRQVELIPVSGASTSTVLAKAHVAAIKDSAVIAWEESGATRYQIVSGPVASRLSRTRAVGTPRVIRSLEGSLLGVAPSATGELMIMTVKKIPWAAYDGVFFSIPDATGTIIGTGLGTVLDGGELFSGHVARQGKYAWITDSRFDAPAGAMRQFMMMVDSPR